MRSIGAIVLAAGGSSRFGQPKQLLTFQGETLIQRAVRAAERSGCGRIAVVVGEQRDLIETELRETTASVIRNPNWQRGLGTSIAVGMQHLLDVQPKVEAAVVLACDQPFVDSGAITALIAKQKTSGKPIVASAYANTLGIPALFARSCFGALLALPDDTGAKGLIASHPDDVARVEFAAGAIDIDTPADLEQLNSKQQRPADNRR